MSSVIYTVTDNVAQKRFEMPTEAGTAFIRYRRADGVVTMTHAEVPRALEGRGVGSALVQGALELVRSQSEKVIPRCPFVAIYIKRHKEFHSLLVEP